MRKYLLILGLLYSLSLFTACGTDSKSASEESVNLETVVTTKNTENMSTGYVFTNGEEYIELISNVEDGNVIARMYDNEPITVYSIEGEWANISYGGMMGYIKLESLSFTKHEDVTETTEEVIKETVKEEVEDNKSVEQINQNIEQSVNIVLISDSDGFQYAEPLSYPTYVADRRGAWCSAQSVYIYSHPTTSSSKREADMLYYGDTLDILGSVDGWYHIATDSGNGYDLHGYVQQKYITIGATPVAPEPQNASYGRVSVGSANVRSSPNKETNNNVMFTIYKGAEFTVLSYDGYWYKINYNGTICYISHKMVEVW